VSHTYIHIHICVWRTTSKRISADRHITHTHTRVYICTHTYIHIHICVWRTCMYSMHACTVYVHVSVHEYVHTHTHSLTSTSIFIYNPYRTQTVNTHAHVCVCVCVCLCVCDCVYGICLQYCQDKPHALSSPQRQPHPTARPGKNALHRFPHTSRSPDAHHPRHRPMCRCMRGTYAAHGYVKEVSSARCMRARASFAVC
jgi:hypothetical protein